MTDKELVDIKVLDNKISGLPDKIRLMLREEFDLHIQNFHNPEKTDASIDNKIRIHRQINHKTSFSISQILIAAGILASFVLQFFLK
jgi:hypothetical protein